MLIPLLVATATFLAQPAHFGDVSCRIARARAPVAAVAERVIDFPAQTASGFGLASVVASATSAASAVQMPPLPQLSEDEVKVLRNNWRLRWQQPPKTGGVGSGFAVCELRADADDVWRAVSAFERYPELISTVRTAEPYEADPAAVEPPPVAGNSVSRFSFLVSRIRLKLDVRFTVDDAQRYAMWQLDRQSWVLSDSTGYWHVEPCVDRPGFVRVWFCVSVKLSKRVPGFVVRLVSRLGLSKATKWLKDLEVE